MKRENKREQRQRMTTRGRQGPITYEKRARIITFLKREKF